MNKLAAQVFAFIATAILLICAVFSRPVPCNAVRVTGNSIPVEWINADGEVYLPSSGNSPEFDFYIVYKSTYNNEVRVFFCDYSRVYINSSAAFAVSESTFSYNGYFLDDTFCYVGSSMAGNSKNKIAAAGDIIYSNIDVYMDATYSTICRYADSTVVHFCTAAELATYQAAPEWSTITTTFPWDDSTVDSGNDAPTEDEIEGWGILAGVKSIFRRIGRIPQQIADFISSAFTNWLTGFGILLESISGGITSIIDGITALPSLIGTKLQELFIPEEITAVTEIKTLFDTKFPIINQILGIGGSLFDFGETNTAPEFNVTLWNTEVNIFALGALSSVRLLVRGIICLFVYLRFFKWLLKFFPTLLGGIGGS